jgi:hypothetical protein
MISAMQMNMATARPNTLISEKSGDEAGFGKLFWDSYGA